MRHDHQRQVLGGLARRQREDPVHLKAIARLVLDDADRAHVLGLDGGVNVADRVRVMGGHVDQPVGARIAGPVRLDDDAAQIATEGFQAELQPWERPPYGVEVRLQFRIQEDRARSIQRHRADEQVGRRVVQKFLDGQVVEQLRRRSVLDRHLLGDRLIAGVVDDDDLVRRLAEAVKADRAGRRLALHEYLADVGAGHELPEPGAPIVLLVRHDRPVRGRDPITHLGTAMLDQGRLACAQVHPVEVRPSVIEDVGALGRRSVGHAAEVGVGFALVGAASVEADGDRRDVLPVLEDEGALARRHVDVEDGGDFVLEAEVQPQIDRGGGHNEKVILADPFQVAHLRLSDRRLDQDLAPAPDQELALLAGRGDPGKPVPIGR